MPIDYTLLKNDINTNPNVASFIGQSDQAIADYYNDQNGPGAMLVTNTLLDKDEFIKKTFVAMARMQQGLQADGKTIIDPAKKTFWIAIFNYLSLSNSFDPTLLSLAGNPVLDNVLKQTELDAITKKTVSRAEALTGQTLTIDNVAKTLGLATFIVVGKDNTPTTTTLITQ